MTDIEKQFWDSVDMDTSDMYSSLSALHFEAYQKKMDEYMKNCAWVVQDQMTRAIVTTLKKAELVPEDYTPKFYFKSTYAGYRWFFFMEPEWYWGKEGDYKVR